MTTLNAYSVDVYVQGASHPVVRNPCRSEDEARALKANLERRIKQMESTHVVRIVKN